MPITRAQVEDSILRDIDGMLALMGMDGSTRDGTNADLAGPIRRAIRSLSPASTVGPSPSDADLATIPLDSFDRIVLLADIQALTVARGKTPLYDQKIEDEEQTLSQVRSQIDDLIRGFQDQLLKPIGPRPQGSIVSPMTTGARIPNDQLAWWRSRTSPCTWPYPS